MVSPVARRILREVLQAGPVSRSELASQLRLRPNSVGSLVAKLVEQGLLRQCEPETVGQGRPRVPLEIDPERRYVVGLSIRAGQVALVRMNLLGQAVGKARQATVSPGSDPIAAARRLLRRDAPSDALLIGVTVPGFVDAHAGRILFSAAVPGKRSVSLTPLAESAGDVPVLLHNDMHALSARWLLTHSGDMSQDVLLVRIADGALGASALVAGTPNRGCVAGGNELGHMRLSLDTQRCYCGQVGCLERVVSSDYLRRRGGRGALVRSLRDEPDGTAAREILMHLATGLANAVNFLRPHRLVLCGPLLRPGAWTDALLSHVNEKLLAELSERVRLDVWNAPGDGDAETSGWLALAGLFCPDWMEECLLTVPENGDE